MKEKKIDIFGSKWSIKYMKDLIDGEFHPLGITDYENKLISIRTERSDGSDIETNEKELTLFHELLHAILDSGQYIEESNNEPLIEWISRCLYSLKQQNVI